MMEDYEAKALNEVINRRGYIVVGSDVKLELGGTVNDVLSPETAEVIEGQSFKILSETDRADFLGTSRGVA
jgi:hypothetical protein